MASPPLPPAALQALQHLIELQHYTTITRYLSGEPPHFMAHSIMHPAYRVSGFQPALVTSLE
ncbi:hypothetical protein DXG03_003903 [Asterophora parasitica]|uniref:Uncharacterized protein n=1 Tax=Asterophora parasitica TaxID=117018 RepID=A0A9P7KFY2_9AGAR|nr:hypothetical protein DXG03_003903 [Asterophora parasitica]